MPGDKYRFGFVTSELFPVTRGGAAVFYFRILGELLQHGHDVHILLDAPEDQAETFRSKHQPSLPGHSQLNLVSISELLGRSDPEMNGGASWYAAKSRQWFGAVRKLLSGIDLDVLEFPDFYGFGHTAIAAHRWMGLAPRTQFVVRAHCSMEQLQEPEIGCYVDKTALLMHQQERLALAQADAVLAPSPSYAQTVRQRYCLTDEQIVLSPLVVAPPPVHESNGTPRDTVLFVGRLFHHKGADTFVDATVRLLETHPEIDRHIRFVLLGYDSHMGPGLMPFQQFLLNRIPHRLRERIEFPGQIGPAQVAQWLSRSLCYVCPSRIESFAYSVHEAAAQGVPLILADLPAFTDLFHDEVNCLKFDGTAGNLANKVLRVIANDSLRNRLSQPRRPVADGLIEPYERLAASAQNPRSAASVSPDPSRFLAVVLESAAETPQEVCPAAQAIAQAWPDARIVKLTPANSLSQSTLHLFGRLWAAAGETLTGEVVMICLGNDRFDVEYLREAAQTFMAHEDIGFIAPLAHSASPVSTGVQVDLELPVWPAMRNTALTRCLMRTSPGLWLADLLDRRAEAYAEIAYLWSLQDRGLKGFQWPNPGASFAPCDITLDNPSIFQSMLLRNTSPDRMYLQSRFLAQLMAPGEPLVTRMQLWASQVYRQIRTCVRLARHR